MDEKISELWGLIKFRPEEKDRIKRGLKSFNRGLPLKTETKWEHSIPDGYCFVLRMYNENPINKSSYVSFLNTVRTLSHTRTLDYVYGRKDRRITEKGKSFLKGEDTPLSMGLYLLLVKEGYPKGIIERTGHINNENLECIDQMCLKEGYVKKVK